MHPRPASPFLRRCGGLRPAASAFARAPGASAAHARAPRGVRRGWRPRSDRRRAGRARRGSVLIVALLLAAIIAVSLASYIKLAAASARLADRSFHATSAVNLAEMGLEEAMFCYNQLDNQSDPRNAWSAAAGSTVTWTIAADNSVTGTLPTVALAPGVSGAVKVYCSHFNPSGTQPVIVARARVTIANGPSLDKWLRITLRKRSLWANGMVARNSILWNGGNTEADSWNSDPDNNSATPPVSYATGPVKAGATVGTPAAGNGSVDIGGGTVRGRIMTGGGTVAKSSGAVLSSSPSGSGWNTSLISTDFSATFPDITVPSPPAGNKNTVNATTPITFPSSLPRSGDKAWNGVYYYEFASGWGLTGAGGPSNIVTIADDVVFLATNHGATNTIDLSGNAGLKVASGGTLKIYTNGGIEAAGNGLANANAQPNTLQIFGTHDASTTRKIRFVGNGSSSAAIYAPNAPFELKGNGELFGAVIASAITMNGNAAFHYDEALGNQTSGNPFGIVEWKELQSTAEQAGYPSLN
jgi:hypothetical protein